MQEAIQKAKVFVEALPYIQAFRHKKVVIKLGGSTMQSPEALRDILRDIVFLELVGVRPILVHGGGARISAEMARRGLKPRFVHGLRYTDRETMEVVEDVLIDQVNREIAELITDHGGHPRGADRGAINLLKGRRIAAEDGSDLGFVGEITQVDDDAVERLCRGDLIPIIPPLASDAEGNPLNVNADTAAASIAGAVKAAKLVMLSDVDGVLSRQGDQASLLSTIRRREIEALIERKVITGGMLPKVRACLRALAGGVEKAHIINGRVPHSLLLELYTDEGVGTEILHDA